MAEAFRIPVISTLNTPSTIPQANCCMFRARTNSASRSAYVAADKSGVIGALANSSSTGISPTLYLWGPTAFNYQIVFCDYYGTYQINDGVNNISGQQFGLGLYSGYRIFNGVSGPFIESELPYGAFTGQNDSVRGIEELRSKLAIKYRLTNCTAPNAPTYAASGQAVAVQLRIASGFQIMSPDDVYVENNGEKIPSSFVNNTITFVMP